MSAITKIADSINSLIEKVRPPIIPIPGILILCSVFKRPGLSPMIMAANIIKRQSEFGAPTGNAPDGSVNKMNALIAIICEEIVKEIRKHCVVESVSAPGTISFTGFGANGGGPIVVNGTNTNIVKHTGFLR